jgi:hypothetical protein
MFKEKYSAKVRDKAHRIAENCEERGMSRDFDVHGHSGM